MLPHSLGEEQSISEAFHECSAAFEHLNRSGLRDSARGWIEKIEGFMDDSNIKEPSSFGSWHDKAKTLTEDERLEFSHAIDELAHWFDDEENG